MARLTTGGPEKKGSQTPVKYTPASTVVWRQKSIHNEGEGGATGGRNLSPVRGMVKRYTGLELRPIKEQKS